MNGAAGCAVRSGLNTVGPLSLKAVGCSAEGGGVGFLRSGSSVGERGLLVELGKTDQRRSCVGMSERL